MVKSRTGIGRREFGGGKRNSKLIDEVQEQEEEEKEEEKEEEGKL